MGASPNRVPYVEYRDDGSWACLSYACQNPLAHHGVSFGRVDEPAGEAVFAPVLGKVFSVVGGAWTSRSSGSLAPINAVFAGMTDALPDGPFPGVKPSDWWAAQSDSERWEFVTAITRWSRARAN